MAVLEKVLEYLNYLTFSNSFHMNHSHFLFFLSARLQLSLTGICRKWCSCRRVYLRSH